MIKQWMKKIIREEGLNVNANSYIEKLISLSIEKKSRLDKLLEFTAEQTEPIKNGNLDRLNQLISSKQEQIDLINSLDDQFNALFNELKSSLGIKDISDSALSGINKISELQTYISEIRNILLKIQELEQKNSILAKEVQKETQKKLGDIRNGRKLATGYKRVIQAPPVFIDKKK